MKKANTAKKAVRLSPPNYTYAEVVREFFKGDKRVKVGEFDGETVKVMVSDADLYDALCQIMVTERAFGGLPVKVEVVPANRKWLAKAGKCFTPQGAIEEILTGNPRFVEMKTMFIPVIRKYCIFAVFKAGVFQITNDNIGSPWKITTMLVENVARLLFEPAGVNYCTEPAN